MLAECSKNFILVKLRCGFQFQLYTVHLCLNILVGQNHHNKQVAREHHEMLLCEHNQIGILIDTIQHLLKGNANMCP